MQNYAFSRTYGSFGHKKNIKNIKKAPIHVRFPNKSINFAAAKTQGEMLEWLKRHAWKACDRQNWFASSNLALSAPRSRNPLKISGFQSFISLEVPFEVPFFFYESLT